MRFLQLDHLIFRLHCQYFVSRCHTSPEQPCLQHTTLFRPEHICERFFFGFLFLLIDIAIVLQARTEQLEEILGNCSLLLVLDPC